jgi:lysophospholipid acyltransferase (LPLAT)-like uncharacterized protein
MAGENLNAETPPPGPRPRKSGVVVPHTATWYQRLAAALIYGLVRGVGATVRFKLAAGASFLPGSPGEKFIYAFWHNRLALTPILRRRYVLKFEPERQIAGMISASRDGGLLTQVFEYFDIEPVRGSSSRRGPQALLEMVSLGERGYDLAITPDGPRGPCYKVQEGVISTAQLTGLPIVPVSYHLNWKIRFNSWDRFQLPLPFARCEVVVGRVLRVPREASEAEREELRQQLEAELRAITRD